MTRDPGATGFVQLDSTERKVMLAGKLPSITKTPTYLTSKCRGLHRCRSGLAHCPPSSRPSQHPYALPHLVPGHSLIGPAQSRRGRGFGWLTFRKPSTPFIAPEACKRSSCAYTFPSYSGSTDRGHKCSLLSPSLCDLPV